MSELYNHECQLNSETKRRCPYCEENICKQPVNHQTCIMKERGKVKKQFRLVWESRVNPHKGKRGNLSWYNDRYIVTRQMIEHREMYPQNRYEIEDREVIE